MAKVRNSANTLRKGRIGENTWYVRNGEQIVRQSRNNSNYGDEARRTELQQERRSRWPNLVNLYKICKGWMPKAFETKEKNQSDYNKFMQLNANIISVYLTKQQAEVGCAVVGDYYLSQGSFASIDLDDADPISVYGVSTFLKASALSASNPTLGDLSEAIIDVNRDWLKGDNLAVIIFRWNKNSEIPRTSVDYKEFTIDPSSTTPLSSIDDLSFSVNSAGFVTIEDTSQYKTTDCGFAVIHTRPVDGSLRVSTSRLWVTDTSVYDFANESHRAAAIASYGVDSDVPLYPGE